jgi:hypothetical protein
MTMSNGAGDVCASAPAAMAATMNERIMIRSGKPGRPA